MKNRHTRYSLLAAMIAVSLYESEPILAQDAGGEAEDALEEVIVTGSRIAGRDGYEAVTPVTVANTEDLERGIPTNLADALNQLPQFTNSRNERSNSLLSFDTPEAGNNLNLRGVGPIRGLILLDGRRVPPTSFVGTVDVNTIPNMLVERVEIVTAGASAVYGADAVSGVVNYILDKDFEGVEATGQYGTSSEGDADTYKFGVAAGASLMDDRLHVLFSAERYDSDGVESTADRPLWEPSYLTVGSGTPDDPYYRAQNVRFNFINEAGLILTGPLAGMTFGPSGNLVPFDDGQPAGGFSIGGDGARWPANSLTATLEMDTLFGRATYQFTDNIEAFAQVSWADTTNTYRAHPNFTFGPDITIFSGNPFLSAEAQQVLDDTGTEAFGMDRLHTDMGFIDNIVDNESFYFTAGLEGKFANDWVWRAHYSYATVEMRSETTNHLQNVEFAAALDAVRDSSGNIVCRVTVTHPGVRDDCVPINVFGVGAPSQAAIDYITDTQFYEVENDLDEIQVDVSGTLFNNWAGPVDIVVGASYRDQSIDQISNSDPNVEIDTTGVRGVPTTLRFLAANNGTAQGGYDTTELFTEFNFPLLADVPGAQRLDLNGAYRYVDYSSFGSEDAWKAGLVWSVNDQLRFRVTESRDIRAPTLFDTFAGRSAGIAGITDVQTGVSSITTTEGGGNPNVLPEEGETFTVGFGYRPDWLPGFSISLDYYDLEIDGIISTVPGGAMIQICFESGHTDPLCDLIERPLGPTDTSPENFPTSVSEVPINLGYLKTDGFDLEANYASESGRWNFRGIVNYVDTYIENSGLGGDDRHFDGVIGDYGTGGPSIPEWSGSLAVTFTEGPWTVFVQERFLSSMTRIGGNIPNAVFSDGTDDASAQYYTDLTLEYRLPVGDAEAELFLTVNNLFDNDPPLLAPINYNPGVVYPTAQIIYDVIGRYYTAGARIRF